MRLMSARIVFMGSPDFALPTLKRLMKRLRLLVSYTTRPTVRTGQKMTPPDVKVLAEKLGLPVLHPSALKTRKR